MTEEWRAVPGFEGFYEVSDQGRFRSLDRVVHFADGRRRFYRGKPLRFKLHASGYYYVSLSKGRGQDGKKRRWFIAHVMVAAAFLGPCPEGMETCHKDGIPTNIATDNLRYDTRSGNHADKMIHGTSMYGEKHPGAKYSAEQVSAIRAADGTITEIAERFGVSRTHAWNIRNDKRRSSLSEMLW